MEEKDSSTSDVKKFFPELKDFKKMWSKGQWHWTTTSMILGRLPLNGEYVGKLDEEVTSELCDCESGCKESTNHFIFECPRYLTQRLGWSRKHKDKENQYKWARNHLFDIKNFIEKTNRFEMSSEIKNQMVIAKELETLNKKGVVTSCGCGCCKKKKKNKQ